LRFDIKFPTGIEEAKKRKICELLKLNKEETEDIE